MSDETKLPEDQATPRSGGCAPVSGYAIPEACFPCSNRYCAQENTYPANMLHWYEKERRWVCENCWDDLDYENEGEDRPEKGMSLETYIVQNRLMAAEILHNDQAHPQPGERATN